MEGEGSWWGGEGRVTVHTVLERGVDPLVTFSNFVTQSTPKMPKGRPRHIPSQAQSPKHRNAAAVGGWRRRLPRPAID